METYFILIFAAGIGFSALIALVIYVVLQRRRSTFRMLPGTKRFTIHFDANHQSLTVLVPLRCDVNWIKEALGIKESRSAIFITGGASGMSQRDIEMTRQIITHGIVRFAEENQLVMIDGGTEAGVMQMIGEARRQANYTFPLIGVSPYQKIEFPGHVNPQKDGTLDSGHSHFVLVNSNEWGDESETIVNLTHAIRGSGEKKALGIVINGGKITRQDVYLATTQNLNLPILVLEGSGRFADELATARKTGQTQERMLKAIIKRADIQLIGTSEGHQGMYIKLREHFGL